MCGRGYAGAGAYGKLTVLQYLREGFGLGADDVRARDGHLAVFKYLVEGFGVEPHGATLRYMVQVAQPDGRPIN